MASRAESDSIGAGRRSTATAHTSSRERSSPVSACVAVTVPSVDFSRRGGDTAHAVSDPVLDMPRELEAPRSTRDGALALLHRPDFRRLFLAVAASELGDSLHYIALMWFALDAGGPLGVVAVRLADSIPSILFGLHGGVAADRWSRKRLMVSADLVRGVVLVPVAVAGLAGSLPLWGLVVAAAVLASATSYFAPAYGATSRRSSIARTSSGPTRSSSRPCSRFRSAGGRLRRHCSHSSRSASSSRSTLCRSSSPHR